MEVIFEEDGHETMAAKFTGNRPVPELPGQHQT
jgi:hypothetical protein